jgi:hypothetical protein
LILLSLLLLALVHSKLGDQKHSYKSNEDKIKLPVDCLQYHGCSPSENHGDGVGAEKSKSKAICPVLDRKYSAAYTYGTPDIIPKNSINIITIGTPPLP